MNPRRQAEVATNVSRTRKAVRIVHRCIKRERAEDANPRYFHKSSANVVFMSNVFQLPVDRALMRNQSFTVVRKMSQLGYQRTRSVSKELSELIFRRRPEAAAVRLAAQSTAEQLNLTAKHVNRGYALTDQVPSNGQTRLEGLTLK
jgi:hypothetical protein